MTLARVVRISVVLVLPLLLIVDGSRAQAYPREIKPGCRYEGRRYQEGTAVSTSEPCLRCRCTEGALRCRLRVCPRLPSALPPGCRVRSPAEDACCAELVCGEPRDVENMLRRASAQTNVEAEDEKRAHHSRTEGCKAICISNTSGCLHEGIRYVSGSAMMGSRRCEYCYCISGARRCIRPKCLLPLPGCTPLYAPHSCCPVAYNCTHHHPSTMAPMSGNGCRVGERTYVEGEMVRDMEWKAACDNCFCAMGAIRCVPLACAPPLQGCSPIVREGQCCPSTYNCSGSIEVKATQNYASYAFISKDYAKFRKETNYFVPAIDQPTNPPVEGRGHRVVEERVSSSSAIDLAEDSSAATYSTTAWPSTTETDIMDNEILIGTIDYKSSLEVTTAATATGESASNTESTAAFESTLASTRETAADSSCTTCSTTLATTTDDLGGGDGSTTLSSPEWTTVLAELTLDNGNDGDEGKNASGNERREGSAGTRAGEKTNIIEKNKAATDPLAISTDALVPGEKSSADNVSTLVEGTAAIGNRPVISPSSTILVPDDILVMNVTVKTNVSVGHIQGVTINPIRSIPADGGQAVANITHREKSEDYEDYDYSQPTLPPSLSNVRIIPFVAADALVKDKDVSSPETGYPADALLVSPKLRPTDAPGFYDVATQENRFSPPVETEGGFVPREPYFDVPYGPTDLNLELGPGVTVDPEQITNPHRKNDDLSGKCHFENTEYGHGEILPRAALCIICMCYYGEVVCFSEKCPPLKIGCRRIGSEERCCGKIVCVQADESPTVVLDRADATAPSQRQPTVSPDPFRDVIKTEPAPDLPSLIEDMIPYLVEHHGITTPRPTTSMRPAADQRPANFDFTEQLLHVRPPPFDYAGQTADSSFASSLQYAQDSLTYDSKDHPAAESSAGVFEAASLNRTVDDATTEQQLATPSDEKLAGQVDNRATQHGDNRTEPNSSSSVDDVKPSATTKMPAVSPMGDAPHQHISLGSPAASSTAITERLTDATVETSSKVLDNEIPMGTLLKLAGCNIYGRMYRVGRIIAELSSLCQECRCTEIGVQCKQLQC